jgi:hypothetical protein
MRLRISMESWTSTFLLAFIALPAAGCDPLQQLAADSLCSDPKPIEVAGQATGYETCGDGTVRRPEILACPDTATATIASQCINDGDCAGSAGLGMSLICVCSATGNQCAVSNCKKDADCNGTLCAQLSALTPNGCPGGISFACTTRDDECAVDADCPDAGICTIDFDRAIRTCQHPVCCDSIGCGRPFLVAGAARSALAEARSDWRAGGLAPSLAGIDDARREALAAYWTRAGLMEHASIAAFARFVLQLLSVGAPPGLVNDAQAAILDESEHARACFALASAYAGRPVGPGPLAMSGALDEVDERSILIMVLREGCIGETVAALEAAEAREHATDPVIQRALEKIAVDEGRHAELAWRYAAWAIARGGEALRAAAREVLLEAFEDTSAAPDSSEDSLLCHGILSAQHRAELRRQAMIKAIRPSAVALLGIDLQSASQRNSTRSSVTRKNSPSSSKRSVPKNQPIRSFVGMVIPSNVASSSTMAPKST